MTPNVPEEEIIKWTKEFLLEESYHKTDKLVKFVVEKAFKAGIKEGISIEKTRRSQAQY